MSPTWPKKYTTFAGGKATRVPLGRTPRAAALDHLLQLFHKGGAVRAFERVFPPLAPQGRAALSPSAAALALQT